MIRLHVNYMIFINWGINLNEEEEVGEVHANLIKFYPENNIQILRIGPSSICHRSFRNVRLICINSYGPRSITLQIPPHGTSYSLKRRI